MYPKHTHIFCLPHFDQFENAILSCVCVGVCLCDIFKSFPFFYSTSWEVVKNRRHKQSFLCTLTLKVSLQICCPYPSINNPVLWSVCQGRSFCMASRSSYLFQRFHSSQDSGSAECEIVFLHKCCTSCQNLLKWNKLAPAQCSTRV